MFDQKAECVLPKESAVREHITEWKQRTASSLWAPQNCSSWYQHGTKDASPTAVWPGTCTEYYFRTRSIRPDKLTFF